MLSLRKLIEKLRGKPHDREEYRAADKAAQVRYDGRTAAGSDMPAGYVKDYDEGRPPH